MNKQILVRGLWKSNNGLCIYGYCLCGREVKKSEEFTDNICPMCGSMLEWELENNDCWGTKICNFNAFKNGEKQSKS